MFSQILKLYFIISKTNRNTKHYAFITNAAWTPELLAFHSLITDWTEAISPQRWDASNEIYLAYLSSDVTPLPALVRPSVNYVVNCRYNLNWVMCEKVNIKNTYSCLFGHVNLHKKLTCWFPVVFKLGKAKWQLDVNVIVSLVTDKAISWGILLGHLSWRGLSTKKIKRQFWREAFDWRDSWTSISGFI